jgi:hypothetical protein
MMDFLAEVNMAAETKILTPSERSYWVVPGKLLAGAYPGDLDPSMAEQKIRSLIEAGIRCFVDLTSPEDRSLFGQSLNSYQDLLSKIAVKRSKVIYRRLPITDLDIPSRTGMVEILDVIDGAILDDLPVYVHCLGGSEKNP